jgi:hypothetical protein
MVGFADDQITPLIKARDAVGKGESKKQPKQSEHRSFDCAHALVGRFGFLRSIAAETISRFQASQHAQKQTNRHCNCQICRSHRDVRPVCGRQTV